MRIRIGAASGEQLNGRLLRADVELGRDVIRVPAGNAEAIAQRIRLLPGVEDAFADPIATLSATVDDATPSSQWGLFRILADMAWETTTAQDVEVAVLDCGVYAHADLAGRIGAQADLADSGTVDDTCNHGTHVAGIIAAVSNNGMGIAGVARGAKVLNGKVVGNDGSAFFSDIDEGIKWATNEGAKVVNLSLNADIACPTSTQKAANYAWNRGTVVVAAAGNSNLGQAGAPANCNNVIGVGAHDPVDGKAGFSNHGPGVDLAAPGTDILSTVHPELNGGALYAHKSGTSMAAPFVAGVAALVAKQREPAATAAGSAVVRDRLLNFTDSIAGTGSTWTKGRLNAAAAVGARANWAVFRPAMQSSTFAGADAARAVDGNTSGSWSDGSLTHTNGEARPWWRVDLLGRRRVEKVDIWNRTDCCGERLTDFSIETSLNGNNWSEARTITGQAGVLTTVTFAPPLEARHLQGPAEGNRLSRAGRGASLGAVGAALRKVLQRFGRQLGRPIRSAVSSGCAVVRVAPVGSRNATAIWAKPSLSLPTL